MSSTGWAEGCLESYFRLLHALKTVCCIQLAKAAEVRARHQEHAAFLLQQAAEKEAARDTQLALRKKARWGF